jgi:hypothetical protein
MSKKVLLVLVVFIAAIWFMPTSVSAAGCDPANIIFSEIDYDQPGADHDEFLELFFPNAVTVSDCEIRLVNGSNTTDYATIDIAGTYTAKQYSAFYHVGIQNGAPDGFALVDTSTTAGTVVWFYSYEGTITDYDAGDGTLVDSTPLTNNGTPVNDSGDESIVNGPVAGADDCVDGNPTPNAANTDLTGTPTAVTLSTLSASGLNPTMLALSLAAILALGVGAFVLRRRAVL